MATSGTATTAFDFGEVAEEAYERCGMQLGVGPGGGYDFRSARRSANLIAAEWANRGLNLWTVETKTLTLIPGQASYLLDADTIDVLEGSRRITIAGQQSDLWMSPMSMSTYQQQTNKLSSGQPLQYFVQRDTAAPTVIFWPVPDSLIPYQFVYHRLRRIQDINNIGNTPDMPFRFIPAFISGLAFYTGRKNPKALAEAGVQLGDLKADYEEQFLRAANEDSQRVSVFLVPRGYM